MAEQTFKSAYGVLKKHADALRTQQEPNIDDLLSIVTESVEAYKVCKARIDAVEAALEQALSAGAYEADQTHEADEAKEAAVDVTKPVKASAGGKAKAKPAPAPAPEDGNDDDIPF